MTDVAEMKVIIDKRMDKHLQTPFGGSAEEEKERIEARITRISGQPGTMPRRRGCLRRQLEDSSPWLYHSMTQTFCSGSQPCPG